MRGKTSRRGFVTEKRKATILKDRQKRIDEMQVLIDRYNDGRPNYLEDVIQMMQIRHGISRDLVEGYLHELSNSKSPTPQ